jgi:hypothetical protein
LPAKSNLRSFFAPGTVPVVRILESPELEPDKIPEVLREINERQWTCLIQVLVESKYKAEAMLRNDEVMHSHGKIAFYQGWVAYADYVIGSLASLRIQSVLERPSREPGPE